MIRAFREIGPKIAESAFIAHSADVIGDVTIGEESSVWFHTVIRGDVHCIRIGARTNIQDSCVLHVLGNEVPLVMGDGITVGHRAVIHGCTIKDRVLIGIGAIVLDGAVIEEDSIVGAGALVTPGTVISPGSFVLGAPAKVRRKVTEDERRRILRTAQNYVAYAREYRLGKW